MAQHDYNIANQSGASFRSDLNNALSAIVSLNSGAAAPSTTFAYQLWADTTAGVLKIRNAANNAWITLAELDGTLTMEAGTAGSPGLYFRGDANTGIFSTGPDEFNIATGGLQRLLIDSSGKGLIGPGTARAVGGAVTAQLSVETLGQAMALVRNSADTSGAIIALGKSRATTAGGITAVADGDILGEIRFAGANGTDLSSIGAHIRAVVNGEVGTASDTTDMPTKLVFSTTPDGQATAAERLAINTTGIQVTGDAQIESLNGGALAGTRNRIINGGMRIDQRNAGASQTFTAAAALAYSVDRWYGYCTGANVTGQQIQGATAGQSRYRFTGAASVTAIGFGQRIEQLNSADLANTTATLSVDLANSVLTSVTWTAYYATTANTFGTLASPTRTQIATGTFTVTSTVTRYSTQISIPSDATTGIEIVFTVGAQTSGTWTIGNVQLEPGSVATPFERRSYGFELALCQRYFQYFGAGTSGQEETSTTFTIAGQFQAPMRAAPTATYIGSTFSTRITGSDRSLTGVSIASSSISTQAAWFSLNNSGGGNTVGRFIQNRDASSNIQMSAEL